MIARRRWFGPEALSNPLGPNIYAWPALAKFDRNQKPDGVNRRASTFPRLAAEVG
jgi:hypothetical protein